MPVIGDLLAGRYRIDARLGAGGMATVWRARDLRLERDVAVKVLLPNLAGDPALAARFDREARALAAISDAHVVAIFDVVEASQASEPFLVMELCPDGSLGDRLADGASAAPEVALPILADAASGLAALHSRGMVHRDITPRNVLLVGGSAKLGDFGLARIEDASTTPGGGLTVTGAAVGTLGYLPPEILDGRTATPASDVYGLGAVAFRALTGALPRPAGSIAELVAARSRAVAPIGTLVPGLPAAAATAIDRALDADPTRRPTAAEVARTFRHAGTTPVDERTTLDAGHMAATSATPGGVLPPAAPSPPSPTDRTADVRPGAPPPPHFRPEPPAPPTHRPDAVPRSSSPGKRRRGRKPLPEAGPDYHGPGFWSGELIAVVVVVIFIVALVLLLGGRPG